MTNTNTPKARTTPEQAMETAHQEFVFKAHLIHENIAASHNIRGATFDLEKARQLSHDAMSALGVRGGLQSMLAAQMLSIHQLQQRTMAYAHGIDNLDVQKYYTNAAVKLTNCFVQQASLLARLQGVGGQKIIVERVDVHDGGQAIVGNIQGGAIKNENNLIYRE